MNIIVNFFKKLFGFKKSNETVLPAKTEVVTLINDGAFNQASIKGDVNEVKTDVFLEEAPKKKRTYKKKVKVESAIEKKSEKKPKKK